ncbi:MAG: hypothetical protein AB1486_13900 [Planctomycetota bacterium]
MHRNRPALVPTLALALFLGGTAHATDGWQLERIGYGWASSTRIDDTGVVHIAYDSDRTLWYARFDGHSWTFEEVYSPVTKYISLTLDEERNPHISFFIDQPYYDLGYARREGGEWHHEVVETNGRTGYWNSIAIHPSGTVCISYYKDMPYDQQGLKFARRHGANDWRLEYLDDEASAGAFSSLVFDSSGRPHVSYKRYPIPGLKYATHSGHGWEIELVEDGTYETNETSITLDSSARPHISYSLNRGGKEELKHAYRTDENRWITETVDNSSHTGAYSSIEIDDSDNIHISYCDMGNGDLRYAFLLAQHESRRWCLRTVDATGTTGAFTSLELNPAGFPVVTYNNMNSPPDLYRAEMVAGLESDREALSAAEGGVVTFHLHAGGNNANRSYVLLGSLSGSEPGIVLPGGLVLPVNWDSFTYLILCFMNSETFQDFMGTLDSSGQALAWLDTLGAMPPETAGLEMSFAYALSDPWDFASNPVAVAITP